MSNRITSTFLRNKFERVAKVMGWDTQPYIGNKAQVGAVYLSHQMGGWDVRHLVR